MRHKVSLGMAEGAPETNDHTMPPPSALARAVLVAGSIWLGSLIIATVAYSLSTESVHSYHGMWSSITFYAPCLVLLFFVTDPTAIEGALCFCAVQLAYYSFGMWTVKRYWSWTHEDRVASGITSNGILEHDVMGMNYLAITSFGLSTEHLLRVVCARLQVMQSWKSAISLLLSAILCVVVQHLLDLSPDGELSKTADHNAALAVMAMATLLLETVARFAGYAGILVFLLEDLPIMIALLGIFAVHGVSMSSHSEEKPKPAFDDIPSSYFHAIVSLALCIQLLLPRERRSKIIVSETSKRFICKRGILAVAFSLAPVMALTAYLARDLQANAYYRAHGLISIAFCAFLMTLAAWVAELPCRRRAAYKTPG